MNKRLGWFYVSDKKGNRIACVAHMNNLIFPSEYAYAASVLNTDAGDKWNRLIARDKAIGYLTKQITEDCTRKVQVTEDSYVIDKIMEHISTSRLPTRLVKAARFYCSQEQRVKRNVKRAEQIAKMKGRIK